MLEKVKEFYGELIADTERAVNRKYEWWKQEFFHDTISQMFGVAQFAQTIGIEYEDIAPVYEKAKAEIEKLYEKWLTNH